ncbi:MAG: hypothetical protein WBW16_13040 [Bacteroidota bacterium]
MKCLLPKTGVLQTRRVRDSIYRRIPRKPLTAYIAPTTQSLPTAISTSQPITSTLPDPNGKAPDSAVVRSIFRNFSLLAEQTAKNAAENSAKYQKGSREKRPK